MHKVQTALSYQLIAAGCCHRLFYEHLESINTRYDLIYLLIATEDEHVAIELLTCEHQEQHSLLVFSDFCAARSSNLNMTYVVTPTYPLYIEGLTRWPST
jgi:hypothetical protein